MFSFAMEAICKWRNYALLAIMALIFSACSGVNHHLILGFDTSLKGAERKNLC